jgi:hypothetical protein
VPRSSRSVELHVKPSQGVTWQDPGDERRYDSYLLFEIMVQVRESLLALPGVSRVRRRKSMFSKESPGVTG